MRNGFLSLIFASLLSGVSFASFSSALVIEEKNGTTLPETVIAEGVSYAYYQVNNETNLELPGTYVKFLPPNVTQVVGPNVCGDTFTLAPSGELGDSCTLKLAVTGSVDGEDQTNSRNLYVCLSDTTSCFGTVDKLDVEVVNALAAGGYCNNDANPYECVFFVESTKSDDIGFLPLLAQRQANDWSFAHIAGDLPEDFFGFAYFSGIGCAENFCMAGGSYLSDESFVEEVTKPLLAMSTNGAANWDYQQYFADDIAIGGLGTVSCANNLCVAGGTQCSGDYCLSDGASKTGFFVGDPLLAYSIDGQDSAFFDVISAIDDQLTDSDYAYYGPGEILASGCSDTKCLVAGWYESEGLSDIPLLLTSDTDGDDWQVIYLPTDDVSQAEFLAATCSSDFCMAGGDAHIDSDDGALLAVQDGNTDWDYALAFMSDLNESYIPDTCEYFGISCFPAEINSISCADPNADNSPGAICTLTANASIAALNATSHLPIIAFSNDGFEHKWTYVLLNPDSSAEDLTLENGGHVIIPANNPPENFDGDAKLNAVSCYENICAVAGSYTFYDADHHDGIEQPLLLQTTDFGNSWYYVDFDFNEGDTLLFDVSCSQGICTAAGVAVEEGRLVKKPNNAEESHEAFAIPFLMQSLNGGGWTFIEKLPDDFTFSGFYNATNAPGAGNATSSIKTEEILIKKTPLI